MDFNWITHSAGEVAYAYQCHGRAGYLSGMQTVSAVFTGLFSLICALGLAFLLRAAARDVVQEAKKSSLPQGLTHDSGVIPSTEDSNASVADTNGPSTPKSTDTARPSVDMSRTDSPPPYDSEDTSDSLPELQTTIVILRCGVPYGARWRAHAFAVSTISLALLIMSLTTLGFALQNLWYCPEILDSEDTVTIWKCLVWILYTFLVFIASSGFVAWIVTFLALWGPHTEVGRGRLLGKDIDLWAIFTGLFFIPIMLTFGVGELIFACQRMCCPGASDDYKVIETEDIELGQASGDSPVEETTRK